MIVKRLASGATAYYWNPQNRDLAAGFTLHREALGANLAGAVTRAHELNAHLDAWRTGRGATQELDLQPGFGTVAWLAERYYRSQAFIKLSDRVKPDYRRELALVMDAPLKDGRKVGDLAVRSVSARFVDKLYRKLLDGPNGRRVRQANICVSRMERAWNVVARLYPDVVQVNNPFLDIERESTSKEKIACSRYEATRLADALEAIGHPHLAMAALVCFEWLQRPENVLDGHLVWTNWRPKDHPKAVQIFHHKTGTRIWYPLEDDFGLLCPEIEARLATLPRLGVAIVVTPGAKGKPRNCLVAAPYPSATCSACL